MFRTLFLTNYLSIPQNLVETFKKAKRSQGTIYMAVNPNFKNCITAIINNNCDKIVFENAYIASKPSKSVLGIECISTLADRILFPDTFSNEHITKENDIIFYINIENNISFLENVNGHTILLPSKDSIYDFEDTISENFKKIIKYDTRMIGDVDFILSTRKENSVLETTPNLDLII